MEEWAMAWGSSGNHEGCGRLEQIEHVSVVYMQDELSGHHRKVEQKSTIDWRNDQSVKGTWCWIPATSYWCQCPTSASSAFE